MSRNALRQTHEPRGTACEVNTKRSCQKQLPSASGNASSSRLLRSIGQKCKKRNPFIRISRSIMNPKTSNYLLFVHSPGISVQSRISLSTSHRASYPQIRRRKLNMSASPSPKPGSYALSHIEPIQSLQFIQCGMGIDTHGQDVTKAAYKAIRDAIGKNAIPSSAHIPGGPDGMRIHVKLGVPKQYQDRINIDAVLEAIPYGKKTAEVVDGGLVTRSGIVLDRFEDKNDDMIMVCAAVEVGF